MNGSKILQKGSSVVTRTEVWSPDPEDSIGIEYDVTKLCLIYVPHAVVYT